MSRSVRALRAALIVLVGPLGGCATPSPDAFADGPPPASVSTSLAAMTCPPEAKLPASVRCLAGRDSEGSHVLLAIPAEWNGILVLHAHGGPSLDPPALSRVEEDLARWAIVPRAGYAWAGTSYHQGGVAVRSAGADLVRLRAQALAALPPPKFIILHGQSWGANVAAKAAETYAGQHLFDGVLLTSGVLAGGSRAYEHRLDLRVVYEALCNNHPRPSEPPYPLWMGLPEGARMSRDELVARADECLGWSRKPEARTPEQAKKLHTLLSVVKIPESSLAGELGFATHTFQDIARRVGWRSVFGNIDARYQGSDDDAALNAAVQRYAADPQAARAYADDTDLTGLIDVPVLTLHAIHDPTAFVEMERRFAERMIAAGRGGNLVQTYSDDRVHSFVSEASYVALLSALGRWLADRHVPTAEEVASACVAAAARYPSTCRFRPDYRPLPLESRVTERTRP